MIRDVAYLSPEVGLVEPEQVGRRRFAPDQSEVSQPVLGQVTLTPDHGNVL